MKNRHFFAGIFWFVLGILLSLWSLSYRVGSFAQPGPGFFPLWLGLLLIFLSLLLLFEKPGAKGESSSSLSGGWRRVVFTVSILLLCAFLFEILGYLLTLFLLVLISMRIGGLQSWRKILFVALLSTLGVYLVFVFLLKQPLPQGLLRI